MSKFRPHKYIKDDSFDPFYSEVNWRFLLRSRLLSIFLIIFSFLISITQIVIPVYLLGTMDSVSSQVEKSILGVAGGFGKFEFRELKKTNIKRETETSVVSPYFYLTIDKLRIKNATVEINAADLNPDDMLGHYTGTSLPGEKGNMFIYGHSVLPVFYNPRNYKTIFSTLGDLEIGDELNITYNGIAYKYKIDSKIIMDPVKVDPLAPVKPAYLNEETITLMTCWPAGSKSKRLLVNAVRVNEY